MFGLGGQVGCERRIKVFVKILKKKLLEGGGGEGRVGGGGVGGGGGVRVYVYEELKFLRKFKKSNWGGGGGRGWGCSGWGGSGWM